jgi:hypothetical protein
MIIILAPSEHATISKELAPLSLVWSYDTVTVLFTDRAAKVAETAKVRVVTVVKNFIIV